MKRTPLSVKASGAASPFRIVPWNADFLDAVRGLVDELTQGAPGKAVIVFPHSRPRRYLTDRYRQSAALPLLLPRMMTGQELGEWCRGAWERHSVQPSRADVLDRVALLWEGVERLARNLPADSPLKGLAGGGMSRFFPWGTRLADLLEECLNQMVDAQDLVHAEGEVEAFAAALLGELRRIRADYLNALAARGLTTPGLDTHIAAQRALHDPPLPAFLRGKTVVLAGFVSLTRAEDALFRYLWRHGATICLHTDPGVAEGHGHWSCSEHTRWIERWQAACTLTGPTPDRQPRLHFFAGYDLHSQLRELRRLLIPAEDERERRQREQPEPVQDSRAVVLPHASLLMPTLHHLPRKDINISLGYPLDRSLLARLVDTAFRVRESRRADGRVHWRPLLDLIRHPYVRMLRLPPEQTGANAPAAGEGLPLRPLLHRLEQRVRTGGRLVRPSLLVSDFLDDVLGDLDTRNADDDDASLTEAAGTLLEHVLNVLVGAWDKVDTLRGAADCLAALADMLLEYGSHIWPRFPIDAECLFRLMQRVIPGMADNAMADTPLPPDALFAMGRQALADERVPFEADPLTGLQVLGMLETRLLHFDRVYLLDLTEDRLPGAPRHDPLMPDSLRGLLGLPDTRQRDVLAAHTFHRLMAGAEDVYLFWQEGVESSGLLDAKKVRSRFVEEALWREEKAAGHRLRPGEGPLRAAEFPLVAPHRRDRAIIDRTPAVAARMEHLLAQPLAPTSLDAYLRCPTRFFRERMCGIRPLEEVQEGDDPMRVGELLHKVLLRAYEPFAGRMVRRDAVTAERLAALFHEELYAGDLRDRLPAESWLMLETAGPLRLNSFLRAQPDEFLLLQVEQEHAARLEAEGLSHTLYGILDRVDRRNGGDVILDYKTGRHPQVPAAFWRKDELWTRLDGWTPDAADPLPALADALPSIQLPCYLYIYSQEKLQEEPDAEPRSVTDAAWVHLAGDGREIPLLGPKWNDEDRRDILENRIPALLRFVLTHMRQAERLMPRPGPHCAWCPYAGACR